MRREFLKGYVLALLAEGAIGAKGIGSAARKVGALFFQDVPAVLAELAVQAGQQGGAHFVDFAKEKISGFAEILRTKGWKAFWDEIGAQHAAGMDSMKGRR